MKKFLPCFLLIVFILCVKSSFSQTTYVWSGPTSGSWNTAGNWQVGGVTQTTKYPGSSGSTDIAQIPTSSSGIVTLTITGTHTIGQITTSGYNSYGVAVVLSGASTALTVSSGLSIIQQNGVMTGFAVSGSGSISLGGTSTLGYQQSMSIASGTTVNFTSGSTLDITASQGSVTNSGTLNFTNSTFKIAYLNSLVSTGKVVATGTDFNQSNASSFITYGGVFNATNCTFEVPSGAYIKSTSTSSAFTATTSTFTLSGSGGAAYIYNNGTWRDHGSTYTLSGQSAYIQNAASSTMHFSGSTVYLGTTGNGNTNETITNAGTFTADSTTNVNIQGYMANVSNSGTCYLGTSGSSCIVTLTAQGANVTNTGTAYLGSTSIIYPTGIYSNVTNTSGTFTLQSDANGSAAIGALNSTAGDQAWTSGTFNVQRYFQGSNTYDNVKGRWVERGYRVISSTVHNTTQVNSNNVFGLNYIVGATAGETTTANSAANAFISGCAGGSTTGGNPSIYLYRESYTPNNKTFTDGNFIGITNITNSSTTGTIGCSDGGTYSIPVGNGVFFFFRGAATNWSTRTVSPFIAPENVTLTSTGTLNTFSVVVKDWYSPTSATLGNTGSGSGTNNAVRGFNMVGNPYACTIDWCTTFSGGITATNLKPTIYVFDPRNAQYATYTATSASGGTATGTGSRYIMSGQGFFVQASANGVSPALTFTENAKAPTQQLTSTSLLMDKSAPQIAGSQLLRLKLSIDSLNEDDIAIRFNSSASTGYNYNEDAMYLPSQSAPEGLSSISADNVRLSLNSVPLPGTTPLVIKLSVDARYTGTFTFTRTQLDEIPKLYDIWLMDNLNRDSLDLRNNSTYVFNANLNDTTTYGNNRFEIVIRQNPALMVHLLSFTGAKASSGSQISWTTENEQNYTYFTVERSSDGGNTFVVVGSAPASGLGTYTLLDKNPPVTSDMYRLKIQDLNGNITYSNIVTLIYGNAPLTPASNIMVYPNPASSVINLNINKWGVSSVNTAPGVPMLQTSSTGQAVNSGQPASGQASYGIRIFSITGAVITNTTSSQPTWQGDVSSLMPGTYVIQVINNADKSLVGRSTFVKL